MYVLLVLHKLITLGEREWEGIVIPLITLKYQFLYSNNQLYSQKCTAPILQKH